ncbi:MAG: glyoxalase/bleomycin resistance/extradiol dioxygenase family protein [Saprospiraceae bacterium]
METKFIRIYPVLSSADVARDIAWWQEKAGFQKFFDDLGEGVGEPKYAGLGRQGIYLHLQWHGGNEDDPIDASAIRIEVENIRPLFEEFVKRGTVTPEKFREKTAWGTNEFGFYDLNNNAIFFFEDAG